MTKLINAKTAKQIVADKKEQFCLAEQRRLLILKYEVEEKKRKAKNRRKNALVIKRLRKQICEAAIDGKSELKIQKVFSNYIFNSLISDGFRLEEFDAGGETERTNISWHHYKGVDIFVRKNSKNNNKNTLITGGYMFWLCQPEGQTFLSNLSEIILNCANNGHVSIELIVSNIETKPKERSAKVPEELTPLYSAKCSLWVGKRNIATPPLSAETICEMLSFLGYVAVLNPDGNLRGKVVTLAW